MREKKLKVQIASHIKATSTARLVEPGRTALAYHTCLDSLPPFVIPLLRSQFVSSCPSHRGHLRQQSAKAQAKVRSLVDWVLLSSEGQVDKVHHCHKARVQTTLTWIDRNSAWD